MIPVSEFRQKIDYILYSDEPEKEYLIHDINHYYNKMKKKNLPAQVIECDFKKREVIAFFEYLTDQDLEKIF